MENTTVINVLPKKDDSKKNVECDQDLLPYEKSQADDTEKDAEYDQNPPRHEKSQTDDTEKNAEFDQDPPWYEKSRTGDKEKNEFNQDPPWYEKSRTGDKEKNAEFNQDPPRHVKSQDLLHHESNFNDCKSKCPGVFLRLFLCFVAGVVFGICTEKSRVFEPENIRHQFVFTNFIMLKVFLAAVLAGQVVLSLLSVLPVTKATFNSTVDSFVSCIGEKGILTSTIGPFILGIGMTLSGACPGIVMVQLATLTPYAVATVCGGFLASLLYGLVAHKLTKFTRPKATFTKHTIFQKLDVSYFIISIPMVIVLTAVVTCLEWFIPWTSEIVLNVPGSTVVTARAWPPFAAGLVIGLLQVVIIIGAGDTLGSSSAYVTVMSQWVVTKRLKDMFPYLARARSGLGNWWQVVYLVGAVIGGGLSAFSSGTYMSVEGVHPAAAFFGGFFMLIGSRFGAGCTSGHGLSGLALLAWLSFLAVPMMFAGGVATSFAMQAAGTLDDFVSW